MSASALAESAISIAAFEAFLERQEDDTLWELVAGEIVAMTNPTQIHEKIVSNIAGPLQRALDGRRCHVFIGGMRVQRSDSPHGTSAIRPDILLRCGGLERTNYVTDALAIAEVLSPSTMDLDRGDKLGFYKGLPTMRHIALVYQDQMRIELYDRTDRGWEMEFLTTPDSVLHFDAVRFALPLREVYFWDRSGGMTRPGAGRHPAPDGHGSSSTAQRSPSSRA